MDESPVSTAPTLDDAGDLIALNDDAIESLFIPEWNRTVHVGSMSSLERDAFEATMFDAQGGVEVRNMRARTAVLCLRTSSGQPMFDNDTPEKIEQNVALMRRKNGKAIDRICAVGLRISGLSRDAVDAAMGNSESDHSDAGASPSDSN